MKETLFHMALGDKGTAILKEAGFTNSWLLQTFPDAFTKKVGECFIAQLVLLLENMQSIKNISSFKRKVAHFLENLLKWIQTHLLTCI